MKFTKKDFIFSIITGLLTGFIAWRVFTFLNAPVPLGASWSYLVIIVPMLWVIGVNLGYFLGRWMPFFNQFGRFAAIGFTNAAVDFGILNLLISYFGHTAGIWYSVFKAISFLGGMTHSYVWNKFWVFDSGQSHGGGTEFGKFFAVSLVAILVNVGVASTVVNLVNPIFNVDEKVWANIGAAVGSAVGLIFSFTGFRLLVFRKKSPEPLKQI